MWIPHQIVSLTTWHAAHTDVHTGSFSRSPETAKTLIEASRTGRNLEMLDWVKQHLAAHLEWADPALTLFPDAFVSK